MRLTAGFASVDITPTDGGETDLCGFAARQQPSTVIGMPLAACIVAFRRGRVRTLLVVCDLLGFTVADSRRLERRMAAAAGVPEKNVLLCCTHTHSGPMSMPLGKVGRFRPAYVEWLGRRLAAGSAAAMADLAPVRSLRLGETTVTGCGEFRCVTDRGGRDVWPGHLRAALLTRGSAPPLVLAHVGIHPYVLGWRSRIVHPDYPGATRRALAGIYGGHAVVLPGCGADVSPTPGMTTSPATVTEFGAALAAAVEQALTAGRRGPTAPLRASMRRPRLRFGWFPPALRGEAPGVNPDDEAAALAALAEAGAVFVDNHRQWRAELAGGRLPLWATFPIHALRLGDVVFVGLPAELFHDTGTDLSKTFSAPRVWVLSQTGGNVGYLPRRFAYEARTYEVAEACQWYRTAGAARPGEERRMRQAAAGLVQAITGTTEA